MFWRCACCQDIWTTHRMFDGSSPPQQVWRYDHYEDGLNTPNSFLTGIALTPDNKVWVSGVGDIAHKSARLNDTDGTSLTTVALPHPVGGYVRMVQSDSSGSGYFPYTPPGIGAVGSPQWLKYDQTGSITQSYLRTESTSVAVSIALDDGDNVILGAAKGTPFGTPQTILHYRDNADSEFWSSDFGGLVPPFGTPNTVLCASYHDGAIFALVLQGTSTIRIYKLDTSGAILASRVIPSATEGVPNSIHAAADGNLLASRTSGGWTRYNGNSLTVIGTSNLAGGTFATVVGVGAALFGTPHSVADDDDGNVYQVGSGTIGGEAVSILKFDYDGNIIERGKHAQTGSAALYGIAVNPATHEFAVCGARVEDSASFEPFGA